MNQENIPEAENHEIKSDSLSTRSATLKSLVIATKNEQSTKGLYRRETHIKSGDHAFIAYNEHRDKEMDGECFAWVLSADRAGTTESYRWFEHAGPETAYPDHIQRIDEILSFFRPLANEFSEDTVIE